MKEETLRNLTDIFGANASFIITDILTYDCNLMVDLVCVDTDQVKKITDLVCTSRPERSVPNCSNLHVSATFIDLKKQCTNKHLLVHRYVSEEVSEFLKKLDVVFEDTKAIYNAIRNLPVTGGGAVLLMTDDENVRDSVRILLKRLSTSYLFVDDYEEVYFRNPDKSYVFFASTNDDSIRFSELENRGIKWFTESKSSLKKLQVLFGKETGVKVMNDIMERDEKRIISIVCYDMDKLHGVISHLTRNHKDHPTILLRESTVTAEHFANTNCVIRITDNFTPCSTGSSFSVIHATARVFDLVRRLGDIFKEPCSVYTSLRLLTVQPVNHIVVLKSDSLISSLSTKIQNIVSSNVSILAGSPAVPSDHFTKEHASCVVILPTHVDFKNKVAHENVTTYVDTSVSVPTLLKEPEPRIQTALSETIYVTEVAGNSIRCIVKHLNGDIQGFDATIGEGNKDDLIRGALVSGKTYDTEHDRKKYPSAVDIKVVLMTEDGIPFQPCVVVGESIWKDRTQLIRVFEEIKVCRFILRNYQEGPVKNIRHDDLYFFDYHDHPTIRYFNIIHRKGMIKCCIRLSESEGFKSFLRGPNAEFKSWLTVFRKVDLMLEIRFADLEVQIVPVACFL